MNSTLLGGDVRQGLKESYMQLHPDDIQLCARGTDCKPWKTTEAGRRRAERIKEKMP